jgi:hypothetical protein
MFQNHGPAEAHLEFFTKPDLALRMWVGHNRPLLSFAERYPDDVLVVSAEALRAGVPLVDWIRNRWSMELEPTSTLSVFDPSAMQKRPGRQPVFDGELMEVAVDTLNRLQELETNEEEVVV